MQIGEPLENESVFSLVLKLCFWIVADFKKSVHNSIIFLGVEHSKTGLLSRPH